MKDPDGLDPKLSRIHDWAIRITNALAFFLLITRMAFTFGRL
jgi:hypothetical protein